MSRMTVDYLERKLCESIPASCGVMVKHDPVNKEYELLAWKYGNPNQKRTWLSYAHVADEWRVERAIERLRGYVTFEAGRNEK